MGSEFTAGSTQKEDVQSWSECAFVQGALSAGELRDIQCTQLHSGRYVAIQLQGKEYLTLCEVEVFGGKLILIGIITLNKSVLVKILKDMYCIISFLKTSKAYIILTFIYFYY